MKEDPSYQRRMLNTPQCTKLFIKRRMSNTSPPITPQPLVRGEGQGHTHIDTNYYDEDEQMKKVFKVAMCGCPLWFFWQGLQQQEEEVGSKLFLMGVSLRERLPNDAESSFGRTF